jgi:hypothetical protein
MEPVVSPATNATGEAVGFANAILGDVSASWGKYVVIFIVTASVLVVNRWVNPRLDPREPPLLKPTVPLVGHIWNLIYKGQNFFGDI